MESDFLDFRICFQMSFLLWMGWSRMSHLWKGPAGLVFAIFQPVNISVFWAGKMPSCLSWAKSLPLCAQWFSRLQDRLFVLLVSVFTKICTQTQRGSTTYKVENFWTSTPCRHLPAACLQRGMDLWLDFLSSIHGLKVGGFPSLF